MSTYFISDLHLGHKQILEFAGNFRTWATTVEEHDEVLIDRINSVVTKRDKLFILGDGVFGTHNLYLIDAINGYKHLVMGNHDTDYHKVGQLLEVYDKVTAYEVYKGCWLTHIPMHPTELRGKKNIHGHVHMNSIRDHYNEIDSRYINVCVEMNNGIPQLYEELNPSIMNKRSVKLN